MMLRILIALGAGMATGVLFVLPSRGMMAGLWLSVLAPMPLMIACMGYGLRTGLAAALVGAAACALMKPSLSLVFLGATAGPALLLAWLSVHVFAGGRRLGPGELLAAVATISILAVWGMLAFIAASYGGLDEALTEICEGVLEAMKNMKGMEDGAGGVTLSDFAKILVVSAPAIMAFWSVLALSLNLWLAGRVTMISGQFSQPWPDLPTTLVLPRIALAAFALATLACILPGSSRVVASCAAVGLGVAFALQGLAAIHRLTRGRPGRSGMLTVLYALIFILFPLPLFVAAGVGVADNVKPLRRPPPKPTSTNP
jgi:hypothetical protein